MGDAFPVGIALLVFALGGLVALSMLSYALAMSHVFQGWWKHGTELSPPVERKKS